MKDNKQVTPFVSAEKYLKCYNEGYESGCETSKSQLYNLDWIQILAEAIRMRPTSWNDKPVREWRNASDEICSALIRALEKKEVTKK